MQAVNGIQNAMINTNAGAQGGMVVDAANAHRSYRDGRPCEGRPVSKHPLFGESGPLPGSTGTLELKQRLLLDADGTDGTSSQTTCSDRTRSDRTWRIDSRHLPEAAWAMLVLSRTLCG